MWAMQFIFAIILFFSATAGTTAQNAVHQLAPVPVSQVRIEDEFWAPKRKIWQSVTIPDCFTKFDRAGAFRNFDVIAAGMTNVPHGGPAWYDGLVYEMISGSADFLASSPDPELEKSVDGYIAKIAAAAAKDPDGYLNTNTQMKEPLNRWGLNEGNDVRQHDLYNAGAMVEAAVHYYRATGKVVLLKTAVKLANNMFGLMGPPPKRNVIPGHALPEEAMLKLYLLFREKPELKKTLGVSVDEANYLKLAEFWIEARGNYEGRTTFGQFAQDHLPVLQQCNIEGHAVRATLMCAGLSALAGVNGREDYLLASLRLWDSMAGRKMYITGGAGATAAGEAFSGNYVLPNTGYLETCAAIGAGFFSHNMNLLLAEARYADELERVLYNAALCGVSLKGDTYTYQNPLEIARKHKRWPWHGSPCCPPMFLKMMGEMPSYMYSTDDKGIYVNLFAGSTARVEVGGTVVMLKQTTLYPWDGKVRISLDMERSEKFDLYVRVPAWCQGERKDDDLYTITGRPVSGAARFSVNGAAIEKPEMVRGYARLGNKWRNGDVVELVMDMPVREVKANPRVEADAGRIALMRGPIVYCLESVDNGDDVRNVVVEDGTKYETEFCQDMLGGVTVVKATVRALAGKAPELRPAELLAIPYYAYLNRGAAELAVWLQRQTKEPVIPEGQGLIRVNADKVISHVSKYMTGACLEDVNHEIYGGLYSQLIFGESFQEPAPPLPMKNFVGYGGRWMPKDRVVYAEGEEGPKLICRQSYLTDGEAEVELMFAENKPGNAGLIVKVSDAGVGANRLYGYEISLDTAGVLVVGRHRNNWEPLKTVPCAVPSNQWITLTVKMSEHSIEALVNKKSLIKVDDDEHTLSSGSVGLRTWQRDAQFRNFRISGNGQIRYVSFELDSEGNSWGYGISGMWHMLRSGSATGHFSLEAERPFAGKQSQRITFKAGEGVVGVENQGLNGWGINFVAEKLYEGYLWVRAERPTEFFVALESRDGKTVYAEKPLTARNAGWERLDFTLAPGPSNALGRFAIKLKQPGSVSVGHAFLQPGEWGRFRGLPVRKDVVDGLVAQGITVLRYGGSMINHREYRWKNMTGPRDRRPPYRGTWYPYSSNGWGIFDFLNLAEEAGFLGIPAINMDETPQDMADFIEYVNGSRLSEWGRKRSEDGHSKPYNLKYLQLGNEEVVNESYWLKFKPLAEAIWAKDPGIILVVGDFAYNQEIEEAFRFRGGAAVKTLETHKKILDLAKAHDREVWFDVHIATDAPPMPNGVPGVRSFAEKLGQISLGARYKVVVFEFNADNHEFRRALANATAINQLSRLGDQVRIACSANCLQPYKQNNNGWDQGMLFLSPSQVWPQPPYYVTQMVSKNHLPLCVKAEAKSLDDALDVTAMKSESGKTLTLQVVNMKGLPVPARVLFNGFIPVEKVARVTRLSGNLNMINTPEQPDTVKPEESEWAHGAGDGSAFYTFPPFSFTIIRFE